MSILTKVPRPGISMYSGDMANTRSPYSLASALRASVVHSTSIIGSMNKTPRAAMVRETVSDITMHLVKIPWISVARPRPMHTAITVAPPMLTRALIAASICMIGIITLTAPSASEPRTCPTTMLPSIEPNDTAIVDITVARR